MFTSVRRRLSALLRPAGVLVLALTTLTATATAAFGYPQGVDVASYQHSTSLDWSKVQASGVQFAFIKATEGRSYTNPYFAGDWAATTQLGIYRGAYHFARPSKGTAAAQARYFVGVAGTAGGQGDLPPVLDLEVTGGLGVSALRTWTQNFLATVESLTGRTPIIYCSPAFWSTNLGNSTAFTHYPLWIAHYTSASQPWVPGGWPTWTFWQNTSGGRVAGISGNTDMDRFNGTLQQLQVLAQVPQGPTPPPTPAPTPVATVTTSSASAPAVYPGQTVHFSTDVTADPAAGGAPLAGRTVALSRQLPGSTYHRVMTAVTDAAGHVDLVATADQSASYQARMVGDSSYASSLAAPMTVTVLPRVATSLGIRPTAHRVRRGQRVTLFGHLRLADGSGLAPRHVVLYRHVLGVRGWRKVTRATSLAPTGWWQAPARQRRATAYRAVSIGGAKYLTARSRIVTVYVRR